MLFRSRAVSKKAGERAGPMVSVIIPVYNGSNYLKEAIESALGQTYANTEVIVVNDGSQDGGQTERIARSYGERICFFSKPNGGVASALNLGIEQMRGEYFSWLSHDDLYLPEKIEREISCLKAQGDPAAIVAEGYRVVDAAGKYIATVNLHGQYAEERLKNPLFVLMRGGIHACALLIHRSHFERVGVFDTRLPTTQDIDFCYRLFRGQRVYYAPFSLVLARGHREQGSRRRQEQHMRECDRLWMGMMDGLSPGEKAAFGGTEFDFYRDLWAFLETTGYAGATRYAQLRMLDCAVEEYRKTGERKDLGLACDLLGISRKRVIEGVVPCCAEGEALKGGICLKRYEALPQGGAGQRAKGARLVRKAAFFLKSGNLTIPLRKLRTVWKRDGTAVVIQKLKRKLVRQ